MANVSPAGVKTDSVCGNSSVDNAECYLPPYPGFIMGGASSLVPSMCFASVEMKLMYSKSIDFRHVVGG